MGSMSIWHWLVVAVIVLLLFGRGKIPELMGDVAKGIKSFKAGMKDEAFSIATWLGMSVPAKTPEAVQNKLSNAIAKVLAKPEVQQRLLAMGYAAITTSTPKEFAGLYKRDLPKWDALVKSVGVQLD